MTWIRENYGTTQDGAAVHRFTKSTGSGIEVSVISLGGIITSIKVPDKTGGVADVVLGFDTLTEYETNPPYLGAIIGRVANRICRGKFTVDGQEYQLAINNPPNHLHGGNIGWDKKVWTAEVSGDSLTLTYNSADGDEGYPGNVEASVTYELTADGELKLTYNATTSKTTPINLTNHTYFNLAGHTAADIYDHTIEIAAERFTPKDENCIPTGEIASVSGTVFDLRKPVVIGDRINNIPDDLGYDHNFCIQQESEEGKTFVARVVHETSGRVLEVYSTQPGVQMYTANYIDGLPGKGGATYGKHCSIALETENYPDAVNQTTFPNALLKPGDTYHHVTWYKFIAQP